MQNNNQNVKLMCTKTVSEVIFSPMQPVMKTIEIVTKEKK